MFAYKLSTYSYEEHSELMVLSKVELTQEELNQKFLQMMISISKRMNEAHHKKIKRTFNSFACIFSEISEDDLKQVGLSLVTPKEVSLVSAWEDAWKEDSTEEYPSFSTQPKNITKDLIVALKKDNIHCYRYYNPWIDEDDYGDYEEDREQEELEFHGS